MRGIGLGDPALLFQITKGSIQRRGPELHSTVRSLQDLFHDCGSMHLGLGECEQDLKPLGLEGFGHGPPGLTLVFEATFISRNIYTLQPEPTIDVGPGPYAPVWQTSPPPLPGANSSIINYDILSQPEFNKLYYAMTVSRGPVFSTFIDPYFSIDYCMLITD